MQYTISFGVLILGLGVTALPARTLTFATSETPSDDETESRSIRIGPLPSCPQQVLRFDKSVSCEDHCESKGYLAGQLTLEGNCRCRKTQSPCTSDSVMSWGGMCYYDICKIDTICPSTVRLFDKSVSCKNHCKSMGYLSGQNTLEGACRCRKTESSCPSNAAMRAAGMCYYDVCKINSVCPSSILGTDSSVSCNGYCKDLDYLAGQTGSWNGEPQTCRCRRTESSCPSYAAMQSGGMCYYDVCDIEHLRTTKG